MERVVPETSATDYLRVIWRRKWLVAAAMVAAASVALFSSSRATRIYASSARILVASSDASVFSVSGLIAPDQAQIATQVLVIQSPDVTNVVTSKLGPEAQSVTKVTVNPVGVTRVLVITVQATSPEVAAHAATLYAETYRDLRRDQSIQEVVSLGKSLSQKTIEAKQQLDDLDARLAQTTTNKASTSEQQSIKLQRDAAAANYFVLQQKVDQAEVDASVRTGGVQVLERASAHQTPVAPRPLQSAALALALGLVLGVVAALGLDFLDDSVKTIEDIERITRGTAPVLAAIPAVTDWRNRDQTRLITIEDPSDAVSEAYRSLRTSVQFIGLRQEARCLQISSPVASEGKTTTLANLAVTLAVSGRRVTIVDCDLRRPRVHEFFGLSNEVGFTSVLLGDQPLSRALQRIVLPDGAVLQLLASGPLPPNPAELLGTTRLAELITALKSESDFVLLDAPPVLPVTDAIVLAGRVDGVMLVATANVTGRRHLTQALAAFGAADSPLVGVVVNGAATEGTYRYNYSSKPARGRRRRRGN